MQVPVPVMRQVYVDVPVPVDQPVEQLVHSVRDVHVPYAMPQQPAFPQLGFQQPQTLQQPMQFGNAFATQPLGGYGGGYGGVHQGFATQPLGGFAHLG